MSASAPPRAGRIRPLLACLLLGAVATLALPPVHLVPALLAFSLWLALLRTATSPAAVAARGFAFGFGWHLAGLYWIGIAFFTDPERFGALAVPAVAGLAALNALFPMVAAALANLRPWRSPLAAALALALAWTVTDGLRETVLLGFTWNPLAIVWAPWPAFLQPAAWIGSPGLTLWTAAIAILPGAALLAPGPRPRRGPAAAAFLLVLLAAGGAVRLALLQPGPAPGTRVRLVQGNIEQHHKWDPDKRAAWFRRHLELSAAPAAGPIDLVVWPESAVPYQIEREPVVRELLGRAAPRGGYLVTGGDRFELEQQPPVAANSVFALDEAGTIVGRYDKVDLVPFGEYLPWRSVLERIGLEKLTHGTIDFVPGPGRRTIRLAGLPAFGPLVCYEAIFPGRAIDPSDRPDFLVNITNDAWFGYSSGPHQHAAMAALRAIEEGLPLVRAANTGVSFATDALGREVGRLGLGATGVLDLTLPGRLTDPPLYRRARTAPSVILFLIVFLGLAWHLRGGSGAGRARPWADRRGRGQRKRSIRSTDTSAVVYGFAGRSWG